MVTPQISGLRNGDALAALAANGVSCAVGDNTWPHLQSSANPHHPLRTTRAANGYDGFAILPRFATEVYYNCSTAAQNEALYNHLYQQSAFAGVPSTIADIVAREARRVMRDGILNLRLDAHMMHQANLAIIDDGGAGGANNASDAAGRGANRSLVMRWVDAVADEAARSVDWPLRSYSLDGLLAAYEEREARDGCGLEVAVELGAGGAVEALTVSSRPAAADAGGGGAAGECAAPLMVPGADGGGGGGPSVETLHFPVARGHHARFPLASAHRLTWVATATAAA